MAEKKIHLSRPRELLSMCGLSHNSQHLTREPNRVTCLHCQGMWKGNKDWYANQTKEDRGSNSGAAPAEGG